MSLRHVSVFGPIHDWFADLFAFVSSPLRCRRALVAENLFLRKQLAFYRERQVRPRPMNDAARFSASAWPCFPLVRMERRAADREARHFDSLASPFTLIVNRTVFVPGWRTKDWSAANRQLFGEVFL